MSLRLSAVNAVLRLVAKPRLRRVTDPLHARKEAELISRLLLPRGRGAVATGTPGPVRMVRFHPSGAASRGAILYFHGGGFVAGSPETHRALLSALAAASRLDVFAPAYRLAPEHPFPAAWEDADMAFAMLSAREPDARRIVLAGDSAGGGLALSLLARLCANGTPPAGVFAFSPWTDLTGSGASWRENAAREVFLPVERLGFLSGLVLAGHMAGDPRASPLFAAFPGAPPIRLFASGDEALRDDSAVLAARLSAGGLPVELTLSRGLPHAWPVFAGLLPEADRTIGEAADFARGALGLSVRPAASGGS
ncbi:MAG: alpha/beta hydrolase [Paracoccaceae bacterium]